MSHAILLDSGPLGLVSNPRLSSTGQACTQWMQGLLTRGTRVVIPEIADYEVRRELIRAGRTKGIRQLDALAQLVEYLPVSTAAVRQAAIFWAEARRLGLPTAHDLSLDADAILAGQAATLDGFSTVIATTNVAHLSRFVPAQMWQDISP